MFSPATRAVLSMSNTSSPARVAVAVATLLSVTVIVLSVGNDASFSTEAKLTYRLGDTTIEEAGLTLIL